jgi:diguanylate cyclase (GGDEF)-like protein/PAS domain S-box-containing protein
MKHGLLRRWLPIAALALVLGGALVFLASRTPGNDTETYLENVALLRQIKQLDARWELDVLKARMGVSTDYDSLVDPLAQLNQLQGQLQVGGSGHMSAALAGSAAGLRQAVDRKTRLIEAFKSRNAVLRNSLAFLPIAAADIHAAPDLLKPGGARGHDSVPRLVNDLLLAAMVYSHASTEEQAQHIQQDLALLAASLPGMPAPLAGQLELFAAHVAAVAREQLAVNKLLAEITAVPTAAQVDALDKLVAQEHRQTSERREQHRRYLLAFAVALAALFLYAAASLIRSHAEINLVNRALRCANATLEQRVEERTTALRCSEERYRGLVESSPDAILVEQDGGIAYANPAALQLFGAARADDLLGRAMLALVAPGDRSDAAQAMSDIAQGKAPLVVEEQALRLDSSTVDVAVSRLAFSHNGQPAVQVIARDISDSRRLQKQLKHLATHDALTQLPNRVLLMDRLSQALAHARRNGRQFVVAVIDLDRFKWVNDSLGHSAGDELLRAVSLRIAEALRESDTLARTGGDEFAVVMHDLQQVDDAIQVLNRIVANVAQPLLLDGSNELAISCSIGCSTFPDDGVDAEELLQSADAAMYQAKELGRNTVQIFNADLRLRAASRARLEAELRHALERGELALHYQPQVDLRSGAVSSVEALLRWQHPELGNVPPGQFIAIAEANGLIIPIGEWVLQQACQQVRSWLDQGLPPVRIAVNVSAKQLARPGLIEVVSQCLKQARIDPACLELELTETVSMDDPQTTIPMLHRLKELGVCLSIDDFGTGYSNMQYLTRLPIDTLKLDGSFVRGITTEPGHRAIAEAVISMAHRLDLRVVAEMTETEGQVVLLHALGCDQAQGWFFAKAMPAAECGALLAKAKLALPATIGVQPECKTLLVLDDEAIITTMVKDLLEADGYQVIVANRAEEAFELLARHAVGVVMSDQCMPGMSGVEFLSAVRRLYPDTTRLIFSAQCDFDAAVAAINRGAVHKFLQKPLRGRELRAVLAEAFEA